LGVPAFLFQEGDDPEAGACFAEVARLTGGATAKFGTGSAEQLKELLKAAAVFAAGGRAALASCAKAKPQAKLLLEQMEPRGSPVEDRRGDG